MQLTDKTIAKLQSELSGYNSTAQNVATIEQEAKEAFMEKKYRKRCNCNKIDKKAYAPIHSISVW